jgi:inosose dehydratase
MQVKIAGAPISWGVCEVPGWGYQMSPERVLAEMSSLGLTATEFGPDGFLPIDPLQKAEFLSHHKIRAIGGFYPILLHDPTNDPIPAVTAELDSYEAAGAEVLVLAASTGVDGYDATKPALTPSQWATLFENLSKVSDLAKQRGVKAVVHPHVGTLIETREAIEKVLAGTTIGFCLDTGHMLIGGTDPVQFSKDHSDRIQHSHLKDVNLQVAEKVRSGQLSYYEAVKQGLYTPLGQGDVDVKSIIKNLMAANYQGWFTLEQDNVLDADPAAGSGPVSDATMSVEFINKVASEFAA